MTSTLNDIRLKVRRVTKSPSVNQISDLQIDNYINTFYLYDFPEHLRQFTLRDTVEFTTVPFVDVYPMPAADNISTGLVSIGNLSGATSIINLFTLLGIHTGATITPGTMTITVAATGSATFTDVGKDPIDGFLTVTGGGLSGQVDYSLGQITLNFTSSIASSAATIEFQYSLQEYISFHPPVYIGGYQSYYTESRQQMFTMYPKIRTVDQFSTSTGITGPYTGTLTAIPVLRGDVLVYTATSSGSQQSLNDDGNGNLVGDGTGTIDYVTGSISVTFSTAPASGDAINAQTVPYVQARPAAILFYANQFTLRPVPDQAYTVSLEAYRRPTALLANGQSPQLKEWWQCLALGAAMKIFEDRGDFSQIQAYRPLLDEQLRLIERRTIVQQTNERTATIYTEQTSLQQAGGYFGSF